MEYIITVIWITFVQKNFQIWTFISQLLIKYRFLKKSPQISHIQEKIVIFWALLIGFRVTASTLLMSWKWHEREYPFQHLSMYCGYVKPKFMTGSRYWFLWESCELKFQEFTGKFGTVSSNLRLKAVLFFYISLE